MSSLVIRSARKADVEVLLELMAGLYAEDGTGPFGREAHRRAVVELLESKIWGRIYVMEEGGGVVGYAVVTWGYSLEYGGRNAFLDEMYVSPAHRSKGLGTQAMVLVEDLCRGLGVQALHLEVERSNHAAQRLYRRHGFVDHDRYLFTKWLEDGPRTAHADPGHGVGG